MDSYCKDHHNPVSIHFILYSPIDFAANKQNTKQEFEKNLKVKLFSAAMSRRRKMTNE